MPPLSRRSTPIHPSQGLQLQLPELQRDLEVNAMTSDDKAIIVKTAQSIVQIARALPLGPTTYAGEADQLLKLSLVIKALEGRIALQHLSWFRSTESLHQESLP
jgi:hypothetical protein